MTAAIGLAAGVGLYFMAIEAAILAFILLRFGARPGPPAAEGLDSE